MPVPRLRVRSLSGLLTLSLALLVLPLLVAVGYGATQLRELSKNSDRLVHQSVETARLTQQLFRDLTSMERTAGLFAVLNDPALGDAFDAAHRAFQTTLEALETQPEPEQFSATLDHLGSESVTIASDLASPGVDVAERVQRAQIGFSGQRYG